MAEPGQIVYEFGDFRLSPDQRILTRQGERVPLMPKGLDTLLFLVQNAGRVVEKEEMINALWPESFVEENNLAQNIFVLRKSLGDDQNGQPLIKTIPRRGYKFLAPVKRLATPVELNQSLLSADYWTRHSPFRGLRVFEPEDAWLFFGRDAEIAELRLRLRRSPVLVVIGNSGCGKSSLVRAGLIPALRSTQFSNGEQPASPSTILPPPLSGNWRVALVRPSASPFDYMAEVLPGQLVPETSLAEQTAFTTDCRTRLPLGDNALRDALGTLVGTARQRSDQPHVLLVVDQFEEIFTLTPSREIRDRYINALLGAARSDLSAPVHVVLVLRADFYSQCLDHPGLIPWLETNLYHVPRMGEIQLRKAMEERLALAGTRAEAGLVDSLLEDVGTEPGDLALLEHALTQLWERDGGPFCTLGNAGYSAIGRLRGALSSHADSVYAAIETSCQKLLAQKIFLKLVHLGEGSPDTRRRVRKEEILALGAAEEVEPLLTRLTSSRLIAVSREGQETFAEVSHEALIREWASLREWITQNGEELRHERKLMQATEEWEELGRDPGALLLGTRLAQGEEWLARHPGAVAAVKDFVDASRDARLEAERREFLQMKELRNQAEARAHAEHQLREQEARSTSHLRWVSFALSALLLVALGAAWALQKQRGLAESRALAARSEDVLSRDPSAALDLALRAWDMARIPETYVAVTKAFPQTLNVLLHDSEVNVALFSPDGARIVTADLDHSARVWNAADGRLLQTLQGHKGNVTGAVFSPDGTQIITSSSDHSARIWNIVSGRLLAVLAGHTGEILDVEFSPDGRKVVTASFDHSARVWDTATGHLLTTLEGHTGAVRSADFSPDCKKIVTAGGDGDSTAKIWNSADGSLIATLQHNSRVHIATFSLDGQRIVTASRDRTAKIWSAVDGHLLATLAHNGSVNDARFSRDGRRIITSSLDHTARVWDADGHLHVTLQHPGAVVDAEFSPDGRHVITAGGDGNARVWDSSNGRLLATLQGHTGPVYIATFSPDGQRALTASQDHQARVWNLTSGRLRAVLNGHSELVWRASFSPDSQRIVTASMDSTARIWDARTGQLLANLQGHTDRVTVATFSPDGQRVVTAGWDPTPRLWSARTGRLLATLEGHAGSVLDATFSPDGQRIVTASYDQTSRVWDATSGLLLAVLRGHTDKVISIAFSPESQEIVTGSWDKTALIWHAGGFFATALKGHTGEVYAVAFSADGQRVATVAADHTARIWNTSDGRLLVTIPLSNPASHILFLPDGRRIAISGPGNIASIWDTSDGHLLTIFQGHGDNLWSIKLSPDGKRVVTASKDGTARIWNTADGKLVAALQGHTDQVYDAEFSPDGQRIVTASRDQTARVWQLLSLDDIEKILFGNNDRTK